MPRSPLVRSSLVGLALVMLASHAAAQPGANVFAHLPKHTLAALRIARLDQLSERLQTMCELLDQPVPPVVPFVLQLEGVERDGVTVVGVARQAEGGYLPFALLPVTDYKTFVRAGDGDAGLAVTPFTLAGEELLASRRGNWVLLTNVVEDSSTLGALEAKTAELLATLSQEQLFSGVVTPQGLAHLKSLAKSTPATSRSLAYRRRLLASRGIDWTDPADWRERLAWHAPSVERWAEQSEMVVAGVDIADDKEIELRLKIAPKQALEATRAPIALPAATLPDQRQVVLAEGPLASPWTTVGLATMVDRILAAPDAVGVDYFDPSATSAWQETVLKVGEELQAVRFWMIAPQKDQPVMCNSAYLCQVEEADAFLEALDASFAAWNVLIERSRRDEDLIFETATLEVEGLTGKRYSVDLPSAVRQEDIPDVREVMQQMFGRNGRMVVDVVPISPQHVLVSDLTDPLRNQLIGLLKEATLPEASEASGWTIAIEPAAWQDWSNDVKRISMGGNIIGWKPKRLASESQVVVHAQTQESTLAIEANIPGDVVAAIAQLWRKD